MRPVRPRPLQSRRRSGRRRDPTASRSRRQRQRRAERLEPRSKTPIAVTLSSLPAAETEPVARSHRSREHPDVGDLLATGATFDLEDRARDGAVSSARGFGQQLRDTGHQRLHASSSDRRTEEDRMHKRTLRLSRKRLAKSAAGDPRLVVHVRGQDPSSRSASTSAILARGPGIVRAPEPEVGGTGSEGLRRNPSERSRAPVAPRPPAVHAGCQRRDGQSCSRRATSECAGVAAHASRRASAAGRLRRRKSRALRRRGHSAFGPPQR